MIPIDKHKIMREELFSKDLVDKHTFEKSILVGIGRDLKLPQAMALKQCRLYTSKLYQMWSDGFTIEYSLQNLTDWVLEGSKTDEDLSWYLHKRCKNTVDMFTV